MIHPHHESKKDFQVERIAFFSDAVFAIAITLLVIEIKVPELHNSIVSESSFWESFLNLLPKLMGFVLSFFIIGLFWAIHHRMFGYVVNYSSKLVWLNLFFLFSIALMPFSTGIYSEYSSSEKIYLITPYSIYVGNICLTGVLNYFLWRLIGNPKNELTENFPQGDFLYKAKLRSLVLPGVFAFSLLIAFINPIVARFSLCLIPLAMRLVSNKKEHKKSVADKKPSDAESRVD